jgi:hypothetical protein
LESGGTSQKFPHFSRVYPLSKTCPTSQNQIDSPKVGGLLESGGTSQKYPHFSRVYPLLKTRGLSKTSLTSLEWKNFIHDKNDFVRVEEAKFYSGRCI